MQTKREAGAERMKIRGGGAGSFLGGKKFRRVFLDSPQKMPVQ